MTTATMADRIRAAVSDMDRGERLYIVTPSHRDRLRLMADLGDQAAPHRCCIDGVHVVVLTKTSEALGAVPHKVLGVGSALTDELRQRMALFGG